MGEKFKDQRREGKSFLDVQLSRRVAQLGKYSMHTPEDVKTH